eukprot:gene11323-biopygen12403
MGLEQRGGAGGGGLGWGWGGGGMGGLRRDPHHGIDNGPPAPMLLVELTRGPCGPCRPCSPCGPGDPGGPGQIIGGGPPPPAAAGAQHSHLSSGLVHFPNSPSISDRCHACVRIPLHFRSFFDWFVGGRALGTCAVQNATTVQSRKGHQGRKIAALAALAEVQRWCCRPLPRPECPDHLSRFHSGAVASSASAEGMQVQVQIGSTVKVVSVDTYKLRRTPQKNTVKTQGLGVVSGP